MDTEITQTKKWYVEHPFDEPGIYISDKSTSLIAKVYNEENAAFIAAAPETAAERDRLKKQNAELLKVLDNVLQHCVTPSGFPDAPHRTLEQQGAYSAARAALRNAPTSLQEFQKSWVDSIRDYPCDVED